MEFSLGVGAGAAVKHELNENVSVKHELTADLAVLSEAVAFASVSNLVVILNQMIVAGEVRIEDEPELEDIQDLDEECSELEYGDEDADDGAEDLHEGYPAKSPFREDVFEIRVRKVDGEWLCDIPQSGWEGAVGVGRYGTKAFTTVSSRMQAYFCIAQMLERDCQELLSKGPRAVKGPICSQRELIEKGCFSGIKSFSKSKDGGASSLSRYLRSVDLAWDCGSLPLRKLFAE